jgi:hypothetical protein
VRVDELKLSAKNCRDLPPIASCAVKEVSHANVSKRTHRIEVKRPFRCRPSSKATVQNLAERHKGTIKTPLHAGETEIFLITLQMSDTGGAT